MSPVDNVGKVFDKPIEIPVADNGATGEATVSNGTGTFTEHNDGNTWAKTWRSTSRPFITLSCTANNMSMSGDVASDCIVASVGGNGATSCAYTLAVASGYAITEISFDAALTDDAVSAGASITLNAGGTTKTLTASAQTFTITGLDSQSLTAFTLAGTNKGVKLANFRVKYKRLANLTMSVNTSTGTFTSKNTQNTWAGQWTSTASSPQLILECYGKDLMRNNISITNSNATTIQAFVGNTQFAPASYNLRIGSGYVITGVAFDVALVDAAKPVTFTDGGGNMLALTTTPQHVSLSGLSASSLTAFTLNGDNNGVNITNLTVTYASSATVATLIFDNAASAIPYRIPAIGKAHNGDLIAVADYRYSTGDIGTGKLDLRLRRSTDNGKTWGPILVYETFKGDGKDGTGNTFTRGGDLKTKGIHQKCAYGDPCIVGDRESSRMMITSCSGYPGFGEGDNTYHQGWARWYSYDDGATWSEPEYIGDKYIYEPLRNAGNIIHGAFIGSGKIHQSRYIKIGDYYRLYCVAITQRRMPNATSSASSTTQKENWVLYSDDFGESWHFLGGASASPVVGGDEPKAEELPDGSVLLSSRKPNGRYYNIFHFDTTKNDGVSGSWGEKAETSFTVNGTSVSESFGTNGEVGIYPVVRTSDNQKMFLALQSLPTSGRNNVKIFYRALDSADKYSTPANFAASTWDGTYQISSTTSAYSTWCLQKDNSLGVLYEESSYNSGYDIQYQNLTIGKITSGAYTYDASYEYAKQEVSNTAAVEALSELISKATAEVSPKLVTDSHQLTCPFGCKEQKGSNSGGNWQYDLFDIDNLVDGNADTYYHTVWQNGSVALGTHYMDVDSRSVPFHGNIFVKVVRRKVTEGHITKFNIKGSNDGTTWTDVADVDMPDATNGATSLASFSIPENTTYDKLRFTVTGTDSGEGYWCMAEFQLYQDDPSSASADYSAEKTALQAAIVTAAEAVKNNPTDADVQALQEAYDAYVNAYGSTVNKFTIDEKREDNNIVECSVATVSLVRTLYSDGWNTFCSPFAIGYDKLKETFGEGVELRKLGSVEGSVVNFDNANEEGILAGVPYLIKPEVDKKDPSFAAVNIQACEAMAMGEENNIQMVGTYNRHALATDGTNLFLGDDNKFYKPSTIDGQNVMNGLRAYFVLSNPATQSFVANIDGMATSLDAVNAGYVPADGSTAVYNLQGQKVAESANAKLTKGIYVIGGKKIVK